MRKATLLACALSVIAVPSASAGDPATSGSVVMSTHKAGAAHVALTLSLRTELQCGRLTGTRALVLTLPAKERVPSTIAADSVLIGSKAAGRVSVAGHVITISPAPPRGMLCDSIKVGVARVSILPAAGLGNPKATGAYTARLTHGSDAWVLPLRIQ
jgi:hypothetical protein